MTNPFSAAAMAEGYAKARPPVHAAIIRRALAHYRERVPFRSALDIGCGSGVSTKALEGCARQRCGIEPAEAMTRWAGRLDPAAYFVTGKAEALPFPRHSFDFMTAAGSLNYVDLPVFFREAVRVLSRDGVLIIYDFATGRSFADSPALDEWFGAFVARYPWPANEARELSPGILGVMETGLRAGPDARVEIVIPMRREAYIDYMLTETNVAAAVRAGADLGGVRDWCADTLHAFPAGVERNVVFRGYYSCFTVM